MAANVNLPARTPNSIPENEAGLEPFQTNIVNTLQHLIKHIKQEKKEINTTQLNELAVDPNDIEAFAENELLKCAQVLPPLDRN